jgi:hypothetical protein
MPRRGFGKAPKYCSAETNCLYPDAYYVKKRGYAGKIANLVQPAALAGLYV